MADDLVHEIDDFLRTSGLGEHRFGILAAKNGRLVERLRSGGRIWPDTEQKVRGFLAAQKLARPSPSTPKHQERVAS